MESLWAAETKLKSFPSLNGDTKTEVLIIGGGMAGILCAYYLEQLKIPYLLVEANRIASGTTCNTTAKITWQHGLIYQKMLKNMGLELTSMYCKANKLAVSQFQMLCQDIDCDYESQTSYLYSLRDTDAITKEIRALELIGYPADYVTSTELPFSIAGAIALENQGQFQPLKFLKHISHNLKIYEHTMVTGIDQHTAYTDKGNITADKIIITTHFPILNRCGFYWVKLYQSRSYVLALQNAPRLNGMYRDADSAGMSFRNAGSYLLVGGASHRTGKSGCKLQALRDFSQEFFPDAVQTYAWAAQDCMTLDAIPYIGQYSPSLPYVYTATGFQKWGMTSSMVAAMILSDLVAGRENPYNKVFSPQRSIWHPQLFLNLLEASCNMLTPSTKRCPHLGCALKWNKEEQSYDCPCHGSRFDSKGKLLDNPSTKNMK